MLCYLYNLYDYIMSFFVTRDPTYFDAREGLHEGEVCERSDAELNSIISYYKDKNKYICKLK